MSAKVAILPATYRTAEEQVRKALDLLNYRPQRTKILLKPNLAAAPRWLPLGGISRAAIVDVRFIHALLRVFAGHEVTLAEGAILAYDTDEVLAKTGVASLAREHGAQVVNLDKAERFEVAWAHGTLRLPKLLQTHEYINVPKLKTHVLTGVSLGCKNQKGLLAASDKLRFHLRLDLHEAISALADAIRPALTIVDGIVGLEGPGPTIGHPRRSHLIVAGRDLRAVDTACCDLISMDLEHVQHLSRASYQVLGSPVEKVRMRFAAPTVTQVANIHIHAPASTCSRCLQSMHEGGAAFWRSPRHVLRGTWSCILHRTDILMGQISEIPPGAQGRVICYGDCTRELAEKHGLPFIAGCPPAVNEHLKIY